ncbi:hypothetical protein Q8A67_021823 [Cirrhinus molitorella]|uniref:Uncharacterized protein n=1 Tax=Cirrhinus molitorella TaxID=172907 RepID=A0AA88PBH6_9TELE|nr:hypothetical protein Q8A67_021823 [Cirrhinus molitorella]
MVSGRWGKRWIQTCLVITSGCDSKRHLQDLDAAKETPPQTAFQENLSTASASGETHNPVVAIGIWRKMQNFFTSLLGKRGTDGINR